MGEEGQKNRLMNLLSIVTNVHTFSGSILVGFIILINNKEGLGSLSFLLLGIGVAVFFLTYYLILSSYKEDDKIDYEKVKFSFGLSILTQLIFIAILIITLF